MVLPTDTEIEVRVNDPLSSETSQQGDRFTGQVASDVVDRSSGRVLIPKDAQVSGRVLTATPSGRLSDAGELQLSINTIRVGDSVVNVAVQPFVDKGESHTRSNTTKIGGGAALGAIIGAIAGGGKGAAIGAGVGGAAGAAGAAATGKRPAEVKPEAVLKFVTAAETTVPASVQLPSTASSQTTGTNDSTYSPSTTTDSDNAPVLQKRGESTPSSTAASSSSTNTSISGISGTSSTTAANSTAPTVPNTSSTGTSGTYGQSNPPASSTSSTNSSIGVQANGTGSSTGIGVGSTNNSYPSTTAPSTTSATNAQVPGRSFSARDRRVINNCIRDHASTLPDSALRKATGVSTAFKAGDTVPTETQRQLRSLPLQCDRELPMLGNDLERVIYGGQVMLIDSTNRVLDAFDVTP
jgi:hypothetical protein